MLGKYWRETLFVRIFGWLKIPMLGFASPTIVELSAARIEVKIPLNWRTRNHLRSMYFGALAVGADTAVGLLAMHLIRGSGKQVDLIFKDFKATYHRRAQGHVHFICEEGKDVSALVDEALKSGERVNRTISAHAIVPSINAKEVVAEFELTLSLKLRA